jgi:GT2 family glycosyltransferase
MAGIKPPVIGYYGAIAEWFDVELVASAARQRPQYTFVLIGGVYEVDVSSLRALPNVHILGERPYGNIPEYLYHFDVCTIPFRISPVTESTDPVKLYEYLSSGKPVVAVGLPELAPYHDLIYVAHDGRDFVTALDEAVKENNPGIVERRIAMAEENTWEDRYKAIRTSLENVTPRASVIVVTYNNLALTRLCLESLFRNTEHLNCEVIVVDNHSTDGTPEYLRLAAQQQKRLKIILNQENRGFSRANNQGIAISTGEHLILLNNDTIVPPGWLNRLVRHLEDPDVGLVGPVTNNIGNEAMINVAYRSWHEMETFAREQYSSHERQVADIRMLAMFCVALRREVYQEIGPLDEQYGVGMFEDDDYSLRVRAKGYRVICAADAFVHHFGQASFSKLIEQGIYKSVFEENRRRFEAKWQTAWVPHRYAPLELEEHMVERRSSALAQRV